MENLNNFDARLKLAKELVSNGSSIREAARKTQIPNSTLFKKIKNKENSIFKGGRAPILSLEEENDIVKWILFMEEWGCPRTRKNVISQVSIFTYT
jgi:hypothetical protein